MPMTLYRECSILLVCSACALSGGSATTRTRESGPELLDDVKSTFYAGGENKSIRDDNAKIDTYYAIANLDASTAKLHRKYWKFWRSPKHKWVAVIYSSDAYQHMGLGKGKNFIFKITNPSDADQALVVVPEDQSLTPHYLKYRATDPLVTENPHKPLVIRKRRSSPLNTDYFALGACLECDPVGHCSTLEAGEAYQ